MARLAEENPGEAEFIKLADQAEEGEAEDWHGLYWRAWEALRFDRQYGAVGGQSPISYLAISRYARDQGIAGDDFQTFHVLLTALDAEWLEHVAEKAKAEEKRK